MSQLTSTGGPDPAQRPSVRRGAAVCLLAAASAAPLTDVFGIGPGIGLVVTGVLPTAIIAVTVWIAFARATTVARLALQALAVAVGVTLPVLRATPDPFGSSSLATRILAPPGDDWRRLLSVDLPVPWSHTFVDSLALYLAIVVTLLCAVAMSSRPGLALVPAVIVFGGLLSLGVHGPANTVVLALGFVVGAVALLATSTVQLGAGLQPVAALLLIVGLGGAYGLAASLPLRDAVDARHNIARPLDVTAQNSPLAQLSSRLERPSATAFIATLSGAASAAPRDWLLATYDTYGGAGWSTRITTEPVSDQARLVPSDGPARQLNGTAVISLNHPAQLLPHQPGVQDAGPVGLRYDENAGVLIGGSRLRTFSVGYSFPSPTVAQLSEATVPVSMPRNLTAVPRCMPTALRRIAEQVARAASLPDERAVNLEQRFTAAPFVFDPKAAPGDSCARLQDFLRTRRGTSEQFATAYAMAARSIGLPARLAVGFGPGDRQGTHRIVTDADARAWVQIDLGGLGWTDFEPTPAGQGKYTRPAAKQLALSKIKKAVAAGHITKPAAHPGPQAQGAQNAQSYWVWVLTAALIVVAFLAAPAATRMLVRWHRRREPDERTNLLNAWRDALASLRSVHVDTTFSTAPQIAAAGRSALGTTDGSLRDLSLLAERAVYGQPVEGSEAALGWQMAHAVRRQVAASLPIRKRLVRYVLALS